MKTKTPQTHYDICIHGNDEAAFQAAARHAHNGDYTALVHTKDDTDKDFSAKHDIMLQALYASAGAAHTFRAARHYGIEPENPQIHWDAVRAHISDAMERIAPHYSIDRLAALGVHIIKGPVQDETITAGKTLHIPPQSAPISPDYEGLTAAAPRMLTLADLPHWPALPQHLIILGGDERALSLAQSLARLGCKTSVVSAGEILDGLDPELYAILFNRFEYEGIRLIRRAEIQRIESGEQVIVHMTHEGSNRRISGSHLLVLAPQPAEENPRPLFVLTDPAVAQIGLNEAQAREKFGQGHFHLVKWRYQESDFAQSMRRTDGLMKLVTRTDGTVIGAGICGASALEMIAPWSLALAQRLRLKDMDNLITPYSAYGRMTTLSIDGYIRQIENPARRYKSGAFWQGLIGR